ncbi:hypothetical protein ACMDB5_09845 [Flavobacterium sp. W1B]|uniref:hypothetical protein n=1 Tax=Flavobacterium sp. W1B TaxID=3394146 RepID=UPI0039BD6656
MIAFGTVSGGAGAALTRGNFWKGVTTGLVVSGLNHAFHQQPDPNKELARRIAKQYGGNAGEIREWLDNHPFELTHEGVKFKGLDLEAKYINKPGTNVKNAINQTPQMIAEELGTKALDFIFRGGPVGQLLSDGGLANNPSPSDIAQRQMRIEGAKNALIRHVFMPQGQQKPSMNNGFNPHSGYSRYNLFYKAK